MTNERLNSCSEEVEHCNSAKMPKTVEIDRISGLPDELVSHILSFLSTKDAVATSVLSKQWRSLWALVPVLNFPGGSSNETKSFMRFFRKRVRTLGRSLAIVRLRGKFGPYFGDWVSKIIASGVRELDLCMMNLKPRKIFRHGSLTSKALVSLRLEDVSFDALLSVHLPCLKILHLQNFGELSEESISQFISGCPVVEDVFVSNYFYHKTKLPLSLFTSQTLLSLNLGSGVTFDFPSSIRLPHLKVLRLQTHQLVWNHEFISLLLSECILLEDLDLSSCGEPLKIPGDLFISKTLVSLKLWGRITLHVPPSVCLPNLRILHLRGSIPMLDNMLGDLLSGCPVLEEIDLSGLHKTKKESSITCVLTVESLLVTLGCRDRPLPYKLKITAPALKHIRILCGHYDEMAWNFPNLQEASVSFEHNIPRKLFSAIRNTKVLRLDHCIFTFGCNLPSLNIDPIPNFRHLKLLEIYNPVSLSYFLPKILENSANLQTLTIASKGDSPDVAWSTPQNVPHCLLHSLKAFGICHFQGLDKETQMVEYILTSGRVLELIVVGIFTLDEEQKHRAQEKLSAIPRCSRTSQLKFM